MVRVRQIVRAAVLLLTAWAPVTTCGPANTPPRDCYEGLGESATIDVELGIRAAVVEATPGTGGSAGGAIVNQAGAGGGAGAEGEAGTVDGAGAGGDTAMDAGAGGRSGTDTGVDVVVPPSSSTLPSCSGIDGLAAGIPLSFELILPPRPDDAAYACRWYRTDVLRGVPEVEMSSYSRLSDGSEALTYAAGDYRSSRWQGCRGFWRLSLYPEQPPPAGNQMSPLEASSTEVWYVRRTLALPQAQLCDGLDIGSGEQECEDIFQVASIELAP